MYRNQLDLFERDDVITLMREHLSGNIKSLKELRRSIEELTNARVSNATIWHQVHQLKEVLAQKIDGNDMSTRNSRIAKQELDEEDQMSDSTVKSPSKQRERRRLARRQSVKNFTPPPDAKRPRISSLNHNEDEKKKVKSVRPKKTEEPSTWDLKIEEVVRREALQYLDQQPDDPMSKAKSKVWLFCEKIDENGGESKAQCKICGMVMVRKLGSTRAMLRHLRKMHSNMIDGIIRPVTKKVTAIAGKPRTSDGFDVDDDSAWVEEIDEEDFEDYDDREMRLVEYLDKEKGDIVEYAEYDDQDCPAYADEVFVHEDGSYVEEDVDEFVDVVYVQDEEEIPQCISKGSDPSISFADACGVNGVHSVDLKCDMPDTDVKVSLDEANCAVATISSPGQIEMTTYEYVNTGSSDDAKAISDYEESDDKSDDPDENFGQLVTNSLKAFAVDDRIHVRAAIMQCIADMREQLNAH